LNTAETSIRETEFFTTSELAKKLKMNVQVITRKVQAGEIQAYKIGKDWRIPEQSVLDWLENHSNRNGKAPKRRSKPKSEPSEAPAAATTPEPRRKFLLEYILAQFEPEVDYAEDEVDRIIARYQNDSVTVRRELVSAGMLTDHDGRFRRTSGYRLSPHV
jgi:excisionase family DNA binding protein